MLKVMAVINRTECFSISLCRIQGIVLFLVLCGAGCVFSIPRNCEDVKQRVRDKGTFTESVLENPGIGLICGEGSCCTATLEKDMLKHTQLLSEKFLSESIHKINSLVDNRAKKFDEFFLNIMNTSKMEFHNMFKKTYGKIYIENSDVFSDFFTELETYYKKGTVRLSDTLDKFFAILFQRMFTVINGDYNFDDRYLECVVEHMPDLKPFGDVSHKLTIQLKRAFVATRMFYKALQLGARVSENMADFKLDENCYKDLTKMQHCGLCQGLKHHRACSSYCTDTVDKCLHGFNEFGQHWDVMIDSIDKVGDRLLGPYNIEAVVEPMNIKISEAIMNFQETGTEVSKKIYGYCGKPNAHRLKRKAEYKHTEDNQNLEVKLESLRPKKKKQKPVDISTLEKTIQEIKTKIKDAKKFWSNLKYQYCNNVAAPPINESDCWSSSYSQPHGSTHPLIKQQIYVINDMTDKLRKAFQGQEVEFIDEESFDGSGSGSGDGFDEDTDKDIDSEEGRSDFNEPDVIPDPVPSSTRSPEVIKTSSANSVNNKMCLSRALVQYILPIVLAWFGGAITDLL